MCASYACIHDWWCISVNIISNFAWWHALRRLLERSRWTSCVHVCFSVSGKDQWVGTFLLSVIAHPLSGCFFLVLPVLSVLYRIESCVPMATLSLTVLQGIGCRNLLCCSLWSVSSYVVERTCCAHIIVNRKWDGFMFISDDGFFSWSRVCGLGWRCCFLGWSAHVS